MSQSKLVVCEKPSVSAAIAAVLGAKERGDGFFHGNGYIVSNDCKVADTSIREDTK